MKEEGSPVAMDEDDDRTGDGSGEEHGPPSSKSQWTEVKLDALDGHADALEPSKGQSELFASLSAAANKTRSRLKLGDGEDFISFDVAESPTSNHADILGENEEKEASLIETQENGQNVDDTGMLPPWIRSFETLYCLQHSMNKMVTLHYEILDFCRFVAPTKSEHQQRLKLVERVNNVVQSLWPSARPVVFGSFATGLYLPTSDVDICILDCPGKGNPAELQALAEAMRSVPGLVRKITVIEKARVPLVKIIDRDSNVQCDISFERMNGPNNVALIRQYLDDFPALKPLLMIVKCFLQQRNLSEVFRGGLGSYALLLLMVSHMQMHEHNFRGPASSLGDMLLDFLDLYGHRFNYCYAGIAIRDGGGYYRKIDKYGVESNSPMRFSIEDPQDENNEIAQNSYACLTIRKAFGNALQLLEAYRPNEATDAHPTPLSMILHIDDLIRNRRKYVDDDRDEEQAHSTETSILNGEKQLSAGNDEEDERYEPQPLYAYQPQRIPDFAPLHPPTHVSMEADDQEGYSPFNPSLGASAFASEPQVLITQPQQPPPPAPQDIAPLHSSQPPPMLPGHSLQQPLVRLGHPAQPRRLSPQRLQEEQYQHHQQQQLAPQQLSYQQGPHQQGPHQQVPHQQGPHQQGPHQQPPHQQIPYQPMPHQPMPHQPMPHQPVPHQQMPHQQMPHQQMPHQPMPYQPEPHHQMPHQQMPHQQMPHQQLPHQQLPHHEMPHQQPPHPQPSHPQPPQAQPPHHRLSIQQMQRPQLPHQQLPHHQLPQQPLPQQSLPQETLPQQPLPQETLPQQPLPHQQLPHQQLPQQQLPQQQLPQQPPGLPTFQLSQAPSMPSPHLLQASPQQYAPLFGGLPLPPPLPPPPPPPPDFTGTNMLNAVQLLGQLMNQGKGPAVNGRSGPYPR